MPNFWALPLPLALILGAASAWTPNLVTPAHAQTPPAQLEIAGTPAVASGRAITNFIDTASRMSDVEKSGGPVAIPRPLAGPAGIFQDEDDGFDSGDEAGISEIEALSSKRHRVRKTDFPGGNDNGSGDSARYTGDRWPEPSDGRAQQQHHDRDAYWSRD